MISPNKLQKIILRILLAVTLTLALVLLKELYGDVTQYTTNDQHTSYSKNNVVNNLIKPETVTGINDSDGRIGIENFMQLPIVESTEVLRDRARFLMQPRIDSLEKGSKIQVFNFVKSQATNQERRDAIRNTWGSVKSSYGVSYKTIFLLGTTTDTLHSVAKEYTKHNDIVLVDLEDTYANVPLKVLAGMQWASENLPADSLYSSTDDDFVMHPQNFALYLLSLQNKSYDFPIACLYSYQSRDKPARNPSSKWFMDPKTYPPSTWPPYCRGGWYTIPVNTVSKLFDLSRYRQYLYLDDVWITGIMRILLYVQDASMKRQTIAKKVKFIRDMGITAAPFSSRSDWQLIHNNGVNQNEIIVQHMWGNIVNKKINVTKEIYKTWKSWDL